MKANNKKNKIEQIDIEKEEESKRLMIKNLCLIVITLLLVSSVLVNLMQYKRSRDIKTPDNCNCNNTIPTRSISIEGYDLTIDGTWNLNIDTNKVTFSNNDETVSLHFELKDTEYTKIIEEESLKKYIEDLQSKENAFISISSENEKDGVKYYYLEGVKDSFPYLNLLVSKDDKTFIVTGVFESAKSLELNKEDIIDLLVSFNKNK